MLYLYPDTNVFLHCKHFEEIDWQDVIQLSDPFSIVLMPIVLNELDKHKYSPQRRRAQKAKALLPRLEATLDDPTCCSFPVIGMAQRPHESVFTEFGLDKYQGDDNLLASIIHHQRQHKDDNQFILISNDSGPRIRARSLNITAIKPPERYLLANEPDEVEKENNKLREELSAFKKFISRCRIVIRQQSKTCCNKNQKYTKNKRRIHY